MTKDLQLTPEQQQQVRPLLQEHHDKIQALLDKNPSASRQELGPQIHAISDETHRQIHALLTDHQRELEKAMHQREHQGEENRRPAPPAAAPPDAGPSWVVEAKAQIAWSGVRVKVIRPRGGVLLRCTFSPMPVRRGR